MSSSLTSCIILYCSRDLQNTNAPREERLSAQIFVSPPPPILSHTPYLPSSPLVDRSVARGMPFVNAPSRVKGYPVYCLANYDSSGPKPIDVSLGARTNGHKTIHQSGQRGPTKAHEADFPRELAAPSLCAIAQYGGLLLNLSPL